MNKPSIGPLVKSLDKLATVEGASFLRISFWGTDHELMDAETLRVPDNYNPRVNSMMMRNRRAAYCLTEAYDEDGRFLDGDTITVSTPPEVDTEEHIREAGNRPWR